MTLCKCKDTTKDREIHFTRSLTRTDQAETAAQLLADVAGIELATPVRPNILHVRYDVRKITLQMLESALRGVNLSLQNNLANSVKRELISYCEDAMRSNLGIETNQQQPPLLSLDKSETEHHNLDPRPDNWRNYI